MNFAADCRRNARRRSTPAARSSTSFPMRSNPTSRAKATRASSDISCDCHWAVNQASSQQIGKMWGKSYVVTPGGVMVPPDAPTRGPQDLAGQEVAVGYHSGSHFTTLQALEPFLDRKQINLKFVGSSWARVDAGLEGDVPATNVWGITYQVLGKLASGRCV